MTDLVRLLDRCSVSHVGASHRHGRDGWLNVDCPYCGSGTSKYHMGLSLTGFTATCWKCGQHRFIDTLLELGVSRQDAWSYYKSGDFVSTVPERKTGTLDMPRSEKLSKRHEKYLIRRGFDPSEIERLWDVKGIRFTVGYEWRLLIPIYLRGEIVSWTTRSILPKAKLRYKTAPPEKESLPSKSLLYGEDYCQHAVIIHEGPLDVWATGPGAVALMGLNWTTAQLNKLTTYPSRIVCFDATSDAQSRANELCDQLSVFPGQTLNVRLETGKDTAEADKREVEELRRAFLDTT